MDSANSRTAKVETRRSPSERLWILLVVRQERERRLREKKERNRRDMQHATQAGYWSCGSSHTDIQSWVNICFTITRATLAGTDPAAHPQLQTHENSLSLKRKPVQKRIMECTDTPKVRKQTCANNVHDQATSDCDGNGEERKKSTCFGAQSLTERRTGSEQRRMNGAWCRRGTDDVRKEKLNTHATAATHTDSNDHGCRLNTHCHRNACQPLGWIIQCG